MNGIGVDIGGSGIRAARFTDGSMGPVARVGLTTRSVAEVVAATAALCNELGEAERVGVGVPGFVHDGMVLGSPNFPGWENVQLRDALAAALGARVRVLNDANAATLGGWDLAGRPDHFVLLTLGTGVGGGVVSHGRLIEGRHGTGTEIGHMYSGGAQRCGCGATGCLETRVGTAGWVTRAALDGHDIADGRAVLEAARHDADWARRIVDDAALALGEALRSLANLFDPDMIWVAGGLSAANELQSGAEAVLRRQAIAPHRGVEVHWAGPADTLAIRGALASVG